MFVNLLIQILTPVLLKVIQSLLSRLAAGESIALTEDSLRMALDAERPALAKAIFNHQLGKIHGTGNASPN
jgi:hypothetical protein